MKCRKLVNGLLVLVLVMGMFPLSTFQSKHVFADEMGVTAENVIEIASEQDLLDMADSRSSYRLTADITLTDWTPINFNGTFDGNGHTITLTSQPLFHTINGTIQNVLLDGEVAATKNAGALAYSMTGGLIQNSWSGASVTVSGYMSDGTAGLVGEMTGGSRAEGILVTGKLTKPVFGSLYGIAVKGQGAILRTSYWTGENIQNAARSSNKTEWTNLKNITEAEYEEVIQTLNDFTLFTKELRTWVLVNGVPKPVGPASTGEGPVNVDKTSLEATLQQAQSYEMAHYTTSSWHNFQQALTEAKTVQDDAMATQTQVNKAVSQLTTVIDQLLTKENIELLKRELDKADAMYYDYADYETNSWQAMWDVYHEVQPLYERATNAETTKGLTDDQIFNAYMELTQAISNLVSILVEIDSAEDLSSVDGTGSYRLTSDITGYPGNNHTLTGKLNGNGHTITFADGAAPLFNTIAKDAEVLNLGLMGNVSGTGAFAQTLSGRVTNSYSWANVQATDQPAGGIAGHVPLNSFARITNTYVTGTVEGSDTGGLIGVADESAIITASYWINGATTIGTGVASSAGQQLTLEEMKKQSFVDDLNKNRTEIGLKWNRNKDGLPYFGSDNMQEGSFHPVVMTNLLDTTTTTITNSNEVLTTTPFGQTDGYVAQLSIPDYTGNIAWSEETEETNSPILIAGGTGKVFVRGTGAVKVIATDADTLEEIQSFTLTAELPAQFDFSLEVEGIDYTGDAYATVGSEYFDIQPVVSVSGAEAIPVSASLFTWTSDNPSVINVNSKGSVTVKKVGTATITVSIGNVQKQLTVHSDYTAVEQIEPTFKGSYYIHGRNPNSIGQNETPGVASFNPLRNVDENGKVIVGSEFHIAKVTPAHATYAKDYTVTSNNDAVLAYKGALQNSLVPMKEGQVTLTVTSNDPKANPQPTGTSIVEIKYFNPLTQLAVKNDTLSVEKGAIIDAGLIFTGPKSAEGYHVTESNITWEQHGTGKVSATRAYPVIMPSDASYTSKEGSVSNDQWRIRGVEEGEVTLIGTPVDDKNGAQPITMTITVTTGEEVVEQPVDQRVKEVLNRTAAFQISQLENATFGAEWTIFGLARANDVVPNGFYETYLSSVFDTVAIEAAKERRRFDDKVTEVQRLSLALTAIGQDPRDVKGINLLDYSWNKEANFPGIKPDGVLGNRQGSNELIFAMLSLEANHAFTMPEHASITIPGIIDKLLSEYQNTNGGFGLYDHQTSSVDITAMALQALAKHYEEPTVKTAVDKALSYLSSNQGQDGSYGTSEATSQVIVALAELGIDPHTDERFTKEGISLLDGLLHYSNANGSFSHIIGDGGNPMATDQALYAIAALDRLYANENSLYNMNDVTFGDGPIEEHVREIRVTPERAELEIDATMQLEATVFPSTATDQTVSWSSDHPNIATVDADGIVMAKAVGTATIIATTNSGGKTASATITVVEKSTSTPEVKETVTFSIEKQTIGEGNAISPATVTIQSGDTAFTLLKRVADEKGISVDYIGSGSTLYVQAIDGVGEFDHGQSSGWMYSVNGIFPEYSAGLYTLSDGDVLRWQYTTNLGVDLGQAWNPSDDKEQEQPGENKPIPTLPEEVAKQISASIKDTQQKLLKDGVKSDWEAIGLFQSGLNVPKSYVKTFHEQVQDQIISKSGKGRMKITDVERLIMTAGVLGIDPTDVDEKGFNLLDKIYNSEPRITGEDSLTFQGNNGVIFALIALDSKNFEIPKDAKWTREKLVAQLLKTQKDDGSWSLETSKDGSTSIDITAMALTALAPYRKQLEVKKAIDDSVAFLSKTQGSTGGFEESFVGGVTSEATAQVIIGLTANGIDPRSEQFTKGQTNLIDHLLSFKSSDGGFKHVVDDKTSNAIATEQALQALVAYDLFIKGKGSLYNFGQVAIQPVPTPFTDVTGHWAADYIQQASGLGIINGFKDGTFRPSETLTRTQTVSILVRALDLKTDKKSPFTDTKNYTDEVQADIAAAYHHGLIKGVGGKFKPTDEITRAEMALLFYRAYEIQNGKTYKGNSNAPFTDMKYSTNELQAAVSMLYDFKMAVGVNGQYMPTDFASRAHGTKMLVQFLQAQ